MNRAGAGPRGLCRRVLALGPALLLLMSSAPAFAQSDASALQVDVAAISKRVRGAVVVVVSLSNEEHRDRRSGKTVAGVHTRVGSGVAVEENGILTTASVVLRADRIVVRTANGLQLDAVVAGVDPVFNVALLRVPGVRLPVLKLAVDRPPQIGDWVLTEGASYRFQLTESVGTINALYREPRLSLLQLSNTVSPGNSGGAAVNPRGELVGIVQGELGSPDITVSPDGERRPTGMSFVMPVETLQRVYEALRRDGRVRHGYLGVTTSGASVPSESQRGSDVPIGALVETALPGGPAAKLGLVRGDLIVGFDGERVEYPGQLARWVAATPPGTSVGLVWVRQDLQKVGSVILGESPDVAPAWAMSATASPAASARSSNPSPERIADIERQIRQLNRQLEQLKGQSPPSRRE
jgi:serine protease Do